MSERTIYSVSAVSRYIKELFRQDFLLHHIYIKGEVSNCKYHSSGHLYFTLKDQGGAISAVMWRSSIRTGLPVRIRDGDRIVVFGDIEVYEPAGRYQIYAKEISVDGSGAFWQEFERCRKKLEEMGMFAQEYKKPIPKYAKRIGVVTAKTGAAIQDIRSISQRRNPYVQLILYPALVQGEGAVSDIVRGIRILDEMDTDVIIVGRGGGSIEDLWAFNSEEVAYAIFGCRTPVISAVGHETDTTIADFVADLRAPTPSAAAELAVAEVSELFDALENYQAVLTRNLQNQIASKRQDGKVLEMHLRSLSPSSRLNENRQRLSELERSISVSSEYIIERRKNEMRYLAQKLDGLSPLRQMRRGYAFVTGSDGKPRTKTSQLQRGDELDLYLSDGRSRVEVKEIFIEEKDENEEENVRSECTKRTSDR